MDADRGVAGAGAAGHQQHAGLAGELAVGLGHERGAALLAAGDQTDLGRVEQRVEHFEIALAGDAEGHLDAVRAQRRDDELAAAQRSKVCRHRPTSSSPLPIGHLRRWRRARKRLAAVRDGSRRASPIIGDPVPGSRRDCAAIGGLRKLEELVSSDDHGRPAQRDSAHLRGGREADGRDRPGRQSDAVAPAPGEAAAAAGRDGCGRRRSFGCWLLAAIVAAVVWLVPRGEQPRPAAGRQSDGPVPVGAAPVEKGDMPVTLTALGTVTPLATVTVKTQING